MAVRKILARGWKFELNTGTEGAPTWVQILGLNTHSWGSDKNDADTTDYESEGWAEHMPASRSQSCTLEGFMLEDPDNGDRDPGQEACEALSELNGPEGLKQFRATSPGGTVRTWDASVNVTLGGGGNDDPSGWSAEFNLSGAPETA